MQTCTQCNKQSPDTAGECIQCGADLTLYSETAKALKKLQSNPRVTQIRLIVPHDACPACGQMEGTYPKEETPKLPVHGCSCSMGCHCFYEPVLKVIYP